MRWLLVLCLLAGTRLGAMVVVPPPPTPVSVTVSVGRDVEPPPPSRPALPAGSRHAITCGDPAKLGTPIARIDTAYTNNHALWSVGAARHACVIVAWNDHELVASFDDGATFAPISQPGQIKSVAIGDTGTIYVLRPDGSLEIYRTDGTTARRALTFGAEATLAVRGKWLWLSHNVVGDQPAISGDDGATWIHLSWTEGGLADLAVLTDGTVVGLADYHMDMCDHFGCGPGPFTASFETTLAGGPWKPASASHARAVSEQRRERDSHGLEVVTDNDSRYIVRMFGRELRAIYVTRPS